MSKQFASQNPNTRLSEYQPYNIPHHLPVDKPRPANTRCHTHDYTLQSNWNHNGTPFINNRGASETDAGKLSFKQILEKAMNNVSDQLMALLEEELDKMEDGTEEIEQQSTSTRRNSRL
ncbi:hypothetical protein QBC45DRAFT_445215 [Copromyces sp. CBS 386.78]|nr:hypothetical protein QBC45DRAFT_445215 [Copromyces sp. CBS 386.78]